MKKNIESTQAGGKEFSYADIKKKTLRGAASILGRHVFINLIAFVASTILSAYLTPEEFGIFGIVTQIIALLIFFSDFGLAATLVQSKNEPTLEDYRTAFTIQQGLSWLIFLVTILIASSGLLAAKTGSVGNWILLSLGLSFPLASLKTISSIKLERELEFSKIVIPQIVEQLLFYPILVAGAVMGYGALSYVPAILTRSIGGVITMWLIKSWPIGLALSTQSLKRMMGFGLKFQLNDFLARIKDQLFFLVLSYYLPLAQFGYILWAKNWSSYPYNMTVQNVMSLTFPTFARLQHDYVLLRKAIEKSLYFISLAIFPILAGMCAFIFPLLAVFPVYQQWQPAAISLILFTISIASGAISTPITNALTAIGKISITLKLMTLWTLLTWILTPISIYYYGYNGVALAAFIISLTSVLPIIYLKRIIQISVIDQIWRQTVAAVGIVVIGVFGTEYWSQNQLWLGIGITLSGLVYCGLLLLLGKNKLLSELKSLRIARV